jgi:hypothetical protein
VDIAAAAIRRALGSQRPFSFRAPAPARAAPPHEPEGRGDPAEHRGEEPARALRSHRAVKGAALDALPRGERRERARPRADHIVFHAMAGGSAAIPAVHSFKSGSHGLHRPPRHTRSPHSAASAQGPRAWGGNSPRERTPRRAGNRCRRGTAPERRISRRRRSRRPGTARPRCNPSPDDDIRDVIVVHIGRDAGRHLPHLEIARAERRRRVDRADVEVRLALGREADAARDR